MKTTGLLIALVTLSQAGCAPLLVGAGAAGAGAAYEARNADRLEELEDDRNAGRVDKETYETKKDAIEDNSVIY